MSEYKYNTYRELAEAYKSGELSEDCYLMLDNDTCFVYDENDNKVFKGNGYNDIDQMADALGIPNMWV